MCRFSFGTVGFGVDRGGVEVRHVVEELVFDVVGDVVRVANAERRRDGDLEVGSESVAFPANSDVAGRR